MTSLTYDQLMQSGAQGLESAALALDLPYDKASYTLNLVDGVIKGLSHFDALSAQAFWAKQAEAYEGIFKEFSKITAQFAEKRLFNVAWNHL